VDDFLSKIEVKVNAPKILRKELDKLYSKKQKTIFDFSDYYVDPKRPIIGLSGGVSDSYQQAEKKYRIMRQILEVLLEYEYPVFLLTKSDLVLRDIELLEEINKKAFANVCFSITQTDEETRRKYEPYSSTTWERLDALKELRKAGIKGGIMAMPIIPYISDSLENMRQLIKDARRVNSEFVLFAGMTLKPGRQKKFFLETVARYNPEKLSLIEEIYRLDNRYGQPDYTKLPVNVLTVGHHVCKLEGMSPRSLRHKCPNEFDANHLVLQVLLDSIFWMTTILGYGRSKWSHIYELAIRVEKGMPDLKNSYKNCVLDELVGSRLTPMIREILQTGTCTLYEEIKQKIDTSSENDFSQIIS
jgi:DNA repair photolyase